MTTSPPHVAQSTQPEGPELPPWAHQVAASLATRPSRASSLVSTRTRFSTNTFQDDAKSIELSVGGQYFRISRDGSKVTSSVIEPLPLYTPALPDQDQPRANSIPSSLILPPQPAAVLMEGYGVESSQSVVQSPLSENHGSPADKPSTPPWVSAESRRASQDEEVTPVARERTEFRDGSAADTTNNLSRNRSYKPGEESITVAKVQRRTVSQSDLPKAENPRSPTSPQLRRRNGIRLPSLITDPTQINGSRSHHLSGWPSIKSRLPLSAGAALPSGQTEACAPHSPLYYGRDAKGEFPPVRLQTKEEDAKPPGTASVVNSSPEEHEAQAMDSENDISAHYTRMVRFIDRDHRRELHVKDKEMAKLRELLNEKDIVYRQELRARDFLIDDLKKRVAYVEDNMERKLEQARLEVEETWEKRWKDRDFHFMERMRRIEADAQKNIEKAIAANERTWETKSEALEQQSGS